MHQRSLCTYLNHSSCADPMGSCLSWKDPGLVLEAHARLLSCWIAEDAPRGSAVPALRTVVRSGRPDQAKGHGEAGDPNVAIAYEAGLFPDIDPGSHTAREAQGCEAVDAAELRRLVAEAVLRPWRGVGGQASGRVRALLAQLLMRLSAGLRSAFVVKTVALADGRPALGELHVMLQSRSGVARLSVLPDAPVPARRAGMTPDPGCSFAGHGCLEDHLVSDGELGRVQAALRAMCAGTVLSLYQVVNNNCRVSFDLRLVPHGLGVVDAQSAQAWLRASSWRRRVRSKKATRVDVGKWDAARAAFRDECAEMYAYWGNELHSPSPMTDETDADPGMLGTALAAELLDTPLHRVRGSDAAKSRGTVQVLASGPVDDWCDTERVVQFVIVGPHEAMLLEIDAVA